jgi:hypothetical protein
MQQIVCIALKKEKVAKCSPYLQSSAATSKIDRGIYLYLASVPSLDNMLYYVFLQCYT